jgi:long-chain acyl-CoA synthetase
VSGPVAVEVLTAADAEGAQRRAAGALVAAGLEPGDRVVFSLPSSSALLCAVLGALRVGVVPVLLNATLLEAERGALVADANPALVVTDRTRLEALDAGPPVALARYPLARPMHYTSGTTGRSKGVWSGLWDDATAEAAFTDEADLWSFGSDDVHLVCSPMYHSVSIRFAGGTLLRGGACVILRRFDAEVARQALDGAFGPVPTTTFMAPSALGRLLASGPGGSARFGSLRLLVHAGSPCPPSLKWAAMDAVGPGVLWEFYGSTEGQFTACPPDEWSAHPGTVGRARPDRTLSVDGDGTIWCRPPGFARFTYWRDEAKTASAWRDGAFTVGDLGRLDHDGYLFLDGRRDDLIITGGVNVYPAEVEAVLIEAEGVAEVAVFGLADDRWGQRVCAALVPAAPGASVDRGDRRRLVEAVKDLAQNRLAGYKRPKQYEVVDVLPRTATGKVQRNRIPDLLGGG